MATAPIAIAGHAPAAKVGGRRMSMSKSPGASKGLSGAPQTRDAPSGGAPQQTETAVPDTNQDKTDQDDKDKLATSPTADAYPRPDKDKDKQQDTSKQDKQKEDQQQGNKKKEGRPAFEQLKQSIPKVNPAMNKASNGIKQPSKAMA